MIEASTEAEVQGSPENSTSPSVGIESVRVVGVTDEEVTVQTSQDESLSVPRASWPSGEPMVGMEVDAFVDREDEPPYASVVMAERLKAWEMLENAAREKLEVTGTVIARVKSGFAVDMGVRAFLPSSQATLRAGGYVPDLVGQTLNFEIETFQPKRMNVVLTRKKILEAERSEAAQETFERLNEGEAIEGQVVGFTNYGMFVDVGGVDGLVHQTDLRWARGAEARALYTLGEKIRVKVLSVNRAEQKVQLGVKQLVDNPWLSAGAKLAVGDRVTGSVVSLTKYGAFVEVLPGVEGMVHVSEMSWTERIHDPKTKMRIGESHEVVVLDLDQEGRRLSLGLKQAQPNPWDAWSEQYRPGTRIEGAITNVAEFGVFVGLEKGLDGLVHVGDMRWGERVEKPSELFKKGDHVEAVVLKVDPESQRLSLGIKQLTEDPWKALAAKYQRGQQIKGKITRLADFGAFVELEKTADGRPIEGLIHVSQLSVDRVERPAEIVTVGQEVDAVVLKVDKRQRKVSLSMRAVHEGLDDDYQDYLMDDGKDFGNSFADAFNKVKGKDD